MSGPRRVIVGASGSPGNLSALRYAESLARICDAALIPIHAWTPPGGEVADRRSPCISLRHVWAEAAWDRLWEALADAWGQLPADLSIEPAVKRGEPGPVLVSLAGGPADLLVVGAGHHGTLTRVFSGRVSRYCLAHARCPVLAVPPPPAPACSHGPLSWVIWHRQLTPERILRDHDKAPT